MSMLRFSAEASLYKESGHYRTGRQALDLPRRTNSMRLALDEGEVIVVRDCRPGWIKLGEGVCIPDPSLPGGGGLPPGTPDEPSGEGPHGPGGGPSGDPADKGDKPTREEKIGKAWRRRCAIDNYEKPTEILECCDKKYLACMKKAKDSTARQMVCVRAHHWCLRPDTGEL
jgi:hypothetical protein